MRMMASLLAAGPRTLQVMAALRGRDADVAATIRALQSGRKWKRCHGVPPA